MSGGFGCRVFLHFGRGQGMPVVESWSSDTVFRKADMHSIGVAEIPEMLQDVLAVDERLCSGHGSASVEALVGMFEAGKASHNQSAMDRVFVEGPFSRQEAG